MYYCLLKKNMYCLITNYKKTLEDPFFFETKNYGSKRKECEARIKNNLIKLSKLINIK